MGVFETLFLLFASQALAAPVDGQEGTKNADGQNGILHLPLVHFAKEVDARDIAKRGFSTPLDNFKYDGKKAVTAVGIVLDVGTPPQKVILEPDTGSSNFWLLGLKPGDTRGDGPSTYFDQKQSQSLQDLNKENGASYGSDERVTYNMVTDKVSFGGTSLDRMKFGVGNLTAPHTNLGRLVGVMGLIPDPKVEDFILDKVLEKNLVKSRAFSLGLREKGKGALAFGGYDTKKFSGPLEKFPMQPHKKTGTTKQYIVEVQSVLFNTGTGNSAVVMDKGDLVNGEPLTMGIDSGAPAFGVSIALGRLLMDRTGAKFKLYPGVLEFGCDVVDAKASFDFKMSNKTVISIPLSDLLRSRIDNGKTCQLAVQPHGRAADLWIGGHFLRRSLVVYDPDNKNVYVARGADCGSNLVAIDGKMPDDAVIGECKEEAPDSNAPTDEPPNTTPVLEEIDIRDP
ncbi:secreted aspartic proteinase [Metarhizium guizhouense ARSEF 977]|uniref:Secreted aspartic proteinase n=1 Tax=Metarhizium guizhouense (strain ARSEF 977) TaxID=1276136 RepID=A0A0B4H3G3_METGA|nr:secreted aspartic proteinase [Metarhizium guizhouense ARSEF 977]